MEKSGYVVNKKKQGRIRCVMCYHLGKRENNIYLFFHLQIHFKSLWKCKGETSQQWL